MLACAFFGGFCCIRESYNILKIFICNQGFFTEKNGHKKKRKLDEKFMKIHQLHRPSNWPIFQAELEDPLDPLEQARAWRVLQEKDWCSSSSSSSLQSVVNIFFNKRVIMVSIIFIDVTRTVIMDHHRLQQEHKHIFVLLYPVSPFCHHPFDSCNSKYCRCRETASPWGSFDQSATPGSTARHQLSWEKVELC